MNLKPLLAEMIEERERLGRAIDALTKLEQEKSADFQERRRGRPKGSRNLPKNQTKDIQLQNG